MKKLVIFDLDGTLLNTIADLAISCNYALVKHGFSTHQEKEYKFFVGNGISKLLERALPAEERTQENLDTIKADFLSYYDAHNTEASTPYPGIPELLDHIQKKGLLVAVASNKYQSATFKLVEHYFPTISFTAILGQRDNIPPKPDPIIVHEIIEKANVIKEDVLYIGDSGVDMQTAKNAGVTCVGVTWGFRPLEELEKFQPEFIVDHPSEIESLLNL